MNHKTREAREPAAAVGLVIPSIFIRFEWSVVCDLDQSSLSRMLLRRGETLPRVCVTPCAGQTRTMTCRIERLVTWEEVVVLRVSGRIRAEHVKTLRISLRREKGRLAIDLNDVLLVAREAVTFLAVSEAKGIELRNCPTYIRDWVTRERTNIGAVASERNMEAMEDIGDG